MPEKTTLDLFNNALAELEQIVAELEINDSDNADDLEGLDESESLTEFEPDKTNFESGADLTGFKNLSGLTIKNAPEK